MQLDGGELNCQKVFLPLFFLFPMKDSGDNADGSQGKSQSARCMMYDIIVFENLHFLPPRFQSPLLLRPFSKTCCFKNILSVDWAF